MVLPNKHSLKAQIISLFRRKPRLTAADIHTSLKNEYTLQAVYKELRSLLAEGIVQKIGTSWTLNAAWIVQLQALSSQLSATYFRTTDVVPSLSERGKQSWSFKNLLDLDDYWGHILLYLLRTGETKTLLSWNPHLWFNVFHTETEDRFFQSVRLLGGKAYTIIGSDCFLNRWATAFLKKNNVTHSFAPGPFYDQMDFYFNVIGNYIVTVRLNKETDKKLQVLFKATKGIENLDIAQFSDLLMKRGQGRITLELNPQKAVKLRKQFSAYFGEDFI